MRRKFALHTYSYGLVLALCATALLLTPVHAEEEGCCEINSIPPGEETIYSNLTRTACVQKNGAEKRADFHENQMVSEDGDSCVDKKETKIFSGPSEIIPPTLSVAIPGFGKFSDVNCSDTSTPCKIPWLSEYIKALYNYSLIIIGVLAVIVMMIGGVIWLTAGGNHERVGEAMNLIKSGILGTVFIACSYTLLFLINPNLTILSPVKISYLEKGELGEMEINSASPGNRDTTECPPGATTISSLATYYTKTKEMAYSQAKRGSCEGDTCYCDCSWFSDHIGRCANLPELEGEGTTWSLIGNPKKVKITIAECNNPSLKPGDVLVWNDGTQGHMQTYIGDNKIIECGGGSFGNAPLERKGKITISDFKVRCSGYMLKRGAYYIKR
jgi:hypothetical protein